MTWVTKRVEPNLAAMFEGAQGKEIDLWTTAHANICGTPETVGALWVVVRVPGCPDDLMHVPFHAIERWCLDLPDDDEDPAIITEGDLLAECRKVDEELAREKRGQR